VSQWIIVHIRQRFRDPERRLWARRLSWTLVGCLLVNIGLSVYLLVFQPRTQWPSVFGPWKQLALVVEEYENQCERESGREPLVVANGEYRLASILAFYRRPLERDVDTSHYTTSQWLFGGNGLGYPYWAEIDHWRGSDCIYIDDGEISIESLQHHFDDVRLVSDTRLLASGRRHWHLAIGRRFH
jgi:hypothetical protein